MGLPDPLLPISVALPISKFSSTSSLAPLSRGFTNDDCPSIVFSSLALSAPPAGLLGSLTFTSFFNLDLCPETARVPPSLLDSFFVLSSHAVYFLSGGSCGATNLALVFAGQSSQGPSGCPLRGLDLPHFSPFRQTAISTSEKSSHIRICFNQSCGAPSFTLIQPRVFFFMPFPRNFRVARTGLNNPPPRSGSPQLW